MSSVQSTISSVVPSTASSSQQIIPPLSQSVHQHQLGVHQLVQQQHSGAHHSVQQPVHTGTHQVVPTQELDSISSAPLGDVHHQQDMSGASISTLSTDTSVINNYGGDTTQVEIHQSEHDVVVSDTIKQQRHLVVTETVMQKFLDKIGTDHFPDFDQYHPGLTWTDKGYIYNPHLMTVSQSRNLSRHVMQFQSEPT